MDVHPTKNVSIGIDPYPYMSLENIPFKILLIKKHIAQARSFRGGDNSLVPEKVVGQAAEYGVCI